MLRGSGARRTRTSPAWSRVLVAPPKVFRVLSHPSLFGGDDSAAKFFEEQSPTRPQLAGIDRASQSQREPR